jgi:lauroyl/myristoyl acyltransferase
MNRSTYPLKLPASIKKAAQRLAREDGVSLNQWISVAVAQKVGSAEASADFFARQATRSEGKGLLSYLENAPAVEPEESDRI